VKAIYALRPTLVPRVWVCYDPGKTLKLKEEFIKDVCPSCDRVPQERVLAKRSLKVNGIRAYRRPALVTEDDYVLFSAKFIDAIKRSRVRGLSFVSVNDKGPYSVGWTRKIVKADDSQMKRPAGDCPKCNRPITAFGPVRLIEKPVGRSFYGLSVEHYTGRSGHRYVVCNQTVYDCLSDCGFDDCFQNIETMEILGGTPKRPRNC
jgi:hypothetical protein